MGVRLHALFRRGRSREGPSCIHPMVQVEANLSGQREATCRPYQPQDHQAHEYHDEKVALLARPQLT